MEKNNCVWWLVRMLGFSNNLGTACVIHRSTNKELLMSFPWCLLAPIRFFNKLKHWKDLGICPKKFLTFCTREWTQVEHYNVVIFDLGRWQFGSVEIWIDRILGLVWSQLRLVYDVSSLVYWSFRVQKANELHLRVREDINGVEMNYQNGRVDNQGLT